VSSLAAEEVRGRSERARLGCSTAADGRHGHEQEELGRQHDDEETRNRRLGAQGRCIFQSQADLVNPNVQSLIVILTNS
jgi:hypothetical protein